MFELMIVRHAKSDWDNQLPDFDRPLSKRGRLAAVNMGNYLNEHGLIPDRMLISSAMRTRQTATLLLDNLNVPDSEVIYNDALYLASITSLLNVINDYAEENQRLLVLAHNPGVDELLRYLASSPPPLTRSSKLMVTCAVAVLQFASKAHLNRTQQGELLALIRPDDI